MKRGLKILIPVAAIVLLAASAAFYAFYVEAINYPKDGDRGFIDLSSDTRTAGYNGALPPDRYGIWPTTEFVTGSPESQGIRAGQLDLRLKLCAKTTDSFAVLRRGVLVYERYFGGVTADTPHYLASDTKGVVAMITGIAVKEGYIQSAQQKVLEFFPEARIASGEVAKRDMTVEHLLTMTCGLEDSWYEDENDPAAWWNAQDIGLANFERPLAAAPGEEYRYSGACYTLLVSLVQRATGRNFFDYAQEKLFGPLGMTSAEWEREPDGTPWGGSGLSLSTHDMLRFGYLLLNEGRWEDKEIIPADWIARARAKGKGPNDVGYMIWNDRWNPGLECFELRGADGQFIMMFPALDMVVARTGHADRDYRGMLWFVRLWAKK